MYDRHESSGLPLTALLQFIAKNFYFCRTNTMYPRMTSTGIVKILEVCRFANSKAK
jgi:hypothetical protein